MQKLWWQAHRFQCLGWLWQEEMFHGDDGFSLARSSLAAVLSQPSTGMLAEEPPTTQAGGMGHHLSSHPHRLSCGQWVLCKKSKIPLASWGHHSLGINATAEIDHAVKAKSFSCCHISKSVLQRWNLTSIYTGLWCDQRALVWRERCSQCWMSFWEAQLNPTLGAFNSNKISKVKDKNLYSALPL